MPTPTQEALTVMQELGSELDSQLNEMLFSDEGIVCGECEKEQYLTERGLLIVRELGVLSARRLVQLTDDLQFGYKVAWQNGVTELPEVKEIGQPINPSRRKLTVRDYPFVAWFLTDFGNKPHLRLVK